MKATQNTSPKNLRLLALTVILLTAPFFRGLFFRLEQFPFVTIVLLLGIISVLIPTESQTSLGRTKWPFVLVAGLAILLWLSVLRAVVPRLAIDRALMMTANVAVMFVAFHSVTRRGPGTYLLSGAIATMSTVQLLGTMASLAGLFQYDSLLASTRVSGFLQYPNAAASLHMLAFFAALDMVGVVQPRWRSLPLMGASVAGLGALLTYSRGGFLSFGVGLIILALLRWKTRQLWNTLAYLLITLVPSFGGLLVYELAKETALTALAGALVVALVGSGILSIVASRAHSTKSLVLAGTSLLGAAGLLVFAVLGRGVPTTFMARFSRLSLQDYNVWSRLQWIRDAVRMAMDYPFGAGGGAWSALYPSYQTWGYAADDPHNFHAELLVATGFPGLLLWLGFWGTLLLLWGNVYWRTRPSVTTGNEGAQSFGMATVAGLAAVFVHAGQDFALSLGAVSFVVFALIGAVLASTLAQEEPGRRKRRTTGVSYWRHAMAAVLLIVVGFNGVLWIGNTVGKRGVVKLVHGEAQEAIAALQQAVRYDPWNVVFHQQLGHAYYQTLRDDSASNRTEAAMKAYRHLERAVALNPFSADQRLDLGTFLLSVGRIEEGLNEVAAALDLEPHRLRRYEQVADVYFDVGMAYLKKDNEEQAASMFARIDELRATLREVAESEPEQLPGYFRTPTSSAKVDLRVAQGKALRGELGEAAAVLKAVTQSKAKELHSEAYAWYGVVSERLGDTDTAQQSFEQARKLDPEIEQFIGAVRVVLTRALDGE